jgi:hypothetical protein
MGSMLSRFWRKRREGSSRDDAFVLVFVTISLTVLLGLAGMAIDVGNWYLHISRAQNASDSAALAGVVYLPDNPAQAIAAAKVNLAKNNVPQQFIDSANIHVVGKGQNDLYVGINTAAQNTFLPFIGIAHTSGFYRSSIATWQPGLGVGDYSNVLGNEPVDPSQPNNNIWESADKLAKHGQFWLSLNGSLEAKESGDRFGSSNCDTDESGCSGNKNTEYKVAPGGQLTAGYDFVVQANPGMPGSSVGIQVFDPALVDVGDDCNTNGLPEFFQKMGNDPRYTPGDTDYCMSDIDTISPTGSGGQPVTMYYQVLDFQTKQPIASCPNQQVFPPFTGNILQYQSDANFLAQFRKWVDICAAPYNSATGSRYIVRVQVNTGSTGDHSFSLRAGLFEGSPGPTTSGNVLLTESQQSVQVYALKDLPLWANETGAQTQFAIANIPPSYAGQIVTFEMFDLGDASAAATLSVISDSTNSTGVSNTSDCLYTPPKSTQAQDLPNCSLSGVQNSRGFNGQVFEISWKVPSDYTCDSTGATPNDDCFLFLKFAYPSGADVTDRTTWSASGSTQPERLVNKP